MGQQHDFHTAAKFNSGLDLRHIVVDYRVGGRMVHAVRGVDLQVAPGEVVGLVGESGCGKSTLAKVICGLVAPTSGSIVFDDVPITPLGFRRRLTELRRIQMVFQNPYASLNPRRTVRAQIEEARAISPFAVPSVEELLAEVQMDVSDADKLPHQFSGGQRQRIAIARAMATSPLLLIGDEPIASLDASLQAKTAILMKQVASRSDSSLLFISHDLSIVRLIATRIVVMNQGRIVETGTTEEIWNHPKEDYTKNLLDAIPVPDGLGHLPAYHGEV
ncbi:ABC transporter ATP-binding protein [Bifidobacterium sp.]|jgi:ABC-type glutathione transport system ATPase component|uniref:ABC transporter ATP-binding protein n=1 Tax=Bifidobacterium sp. TaxID=41200 RepID=UPI0025C252DB|nr:ATP-binding cassette domain-containing protein [Bifidobacterium sp.]MCH4209346.1 ATP-binding cassette domain-containing protein [Bifidobacterium sp.]MCI1224140.1 ATP-binding cassette domain-containing protein [Bifidobacterium sp.]